MFILNIDFNWILLSVVLFQNMTDVYIVYMLALKCCSCLSLDLITAHRKHTVHTVDCKGGVVCFTVELDLGNKC